MSKKRKTPAHHGPTGYQRMRHSADPPPQSHIEIKDIPAGSRVERSNPARYDVGSRSRAEGAASTYAAEDRLVDPSKGRLGPDPWTEKSRVLSEWRKTPQPLPGGLIEQDQKFRQSQTKEQYEEYLIQRTRKGIEP